MNHCIKSINTMILLVVFSISSIYSAGDCLSKYKCKLDINGTKIMGIQSCTLPSMPKMHITASDVLNADGTLKYYFGTGKTVCDVLGWMDEGAVKFSGIKGTGYLNTGYLNKSN